jgi:signal transduction histidine kinase
VSYFWDIPGVDRHAFSEEYIRISFTANFVIALFTCGAIVYFLIDVNHHSETEILQKNEELKKANAELDRFVYSASHDLKAPLNSLRGLIDLAKRAGNVDDIKDMLNRMHGSVNNLSRFITDIIDYSRNSRKEIVISTINLHQLTINIIETLKYADQSGQLKIECGIPLNLEINSDEARVKVILSNLISNSIKHHDPQKDEKYIKISATKNNESVTISVHDNGLGIEEDHHPKIFDMFYRASERSDGSGLGLFIVNETIARLGGNITFASKPNEGSEFIVRLPCE